MLDRTICSSVNWLTPGLYIDNFLLTENLPVLDTMS